MDWWEANTDYNGEPVVQTELLKCPVCKRILETREKGKSLFSYCKECKTTFFFEGGSKVPSSAVPDSCLACKKTKCGCGRCGR